MNENKNKNITWINTIKAICIIDIFFVHCQAHYGYSFDSINLFTKFFYVNAFYFVSGYLLFWKQLSEPIIIEDKHYYVSCGGGKTLASNILFRIIIPSVLFSFLEFVPSTIIQGRSFELNYALYKTIGGGTYWFTSSLVFAEFVLLFLFFTRRKSIWYYFPICLFISMLGLFLVKKLTIESGVWAWPQGLISLVFLSFGGLYWRYEKEIDNIMKWWVVLLLILIFVCSVLCFKGFNDPLISTLTIQPLGVLISIISCVILIYICKIIPFIEFISFIGKNSLGFYFLSGALPIAMSIGIHRLFTVKGLSLNIFQNALSVVMLCVASLLIAYLFVHFANNYAPWLWDMRKVKKNTE